MAESPSHKFGQLIGDVLEETIEPFLQDFASKHNLFLDKKGERNGRKGKKVTWTDDAGNKHDLDFVLERGGSENKIGVPVAFIESAWRRYTKHSRNKAQEIEGALLPLYQKYKNYSPFLGTILAGEFTSGAITQLESNGFVVLYFPYQSIVKAFSKVGIDASSEETTPDREFAKKLNQWGDLSTQKKKLVSEYLVHLESKNITKFMRELKIVIERKISTIRILSLHGDLNILNSVTAAISFISKYDTQKTSTKFARFEIEVHYSNKDIVKGQFTSKITATRFLENYL